MKCEGLCKTCDNRDVRHVLTGNRLYEERLTCDYDMQPFPRAQTCDMYVEMSPYGGKDAEQD